MNSLFRFADCSLLPHTWFLNYGNRIWSGTVNAQKLENIFQRNHFQQHKPFFSDRVTMPPPYLRPSSFTFLSKELALTFSSLYTNEGGSFTSLSFP